MHREWNARLTAASTEQNDWLSRLTDSVLVVAILFLICQIINTAFPPVFRIFGQPGMLLSVLGLLAVSMFALQQSLILKLSEPARAWFGITGGLLAWAVVYNSAKINGNNLANFSSIIIMMMVVLMMLLLWKSMFPLGLRFFSLTLVFNWAVFIIMTVFGQMAEYSPIFFLLYKVTAAVSVIAGVIVFGWVLFQARQRIQRIRGALLIWFLISIALYVYRGSIF
jgi:hypothetical protein